MNFSIDISKFNSDFENKVSPLQKNLPKVKLYELDLSDFADKQTELSTEESYASWSKAMSLNTSLDGLRSSGFWRAFYETMIGDTLDMDLEGLALDNSVGKTDCVMQFIPQHASQQKGAASMVEDIAKEVLGSKYLVKLISGSNGVTNKSAEKETEKLIEIARKQGKKVWVISQGMASRSYSISDIDTVLLTYDKGALGATVQKLSRALTAGDDDNKVGKIVSISVDPNRDDKLPGMIMEAAIKAKEQRGTELSDEIRRAHATFPLFVNRDGNQLRLSEDEYLELAMKLNTVKRVGAVDKGRMISIDGEVVSDIMDRISSKKSPVHRIGEKERGAMGERFMDKATPRNNKERTSNENKVREELYRHLTNFVDVVEYLSYLVSDEKPSIRYILETTEKDSDLMEEFVDISGMHTSVVRECLDNKMLNEMKLDLTILSSRIM